LTESRQVGGDRPDGNHYRDVAGKLRELARYCRFAGARRELLQLATNYDGRADHPECGTPIYAAAPEPNPSTVKFNKMDDQG
jgi:hypothetical protein